MSKFFQRLSVLGAIILLPWTMTAQQLPNPSFEDWSGEKFDSKIQPASWHASNVEQVGFKFNFAHQEAGHTGNYSMMVQDQDVGAAGITETSPGYFSLGQPWVYLESITKISQATAGTAGGVSWKYRPDSMSVWIRRTGNNNDKEDFYLLYYAWSGTAVGNKFKGKNGNCTSVTKNDEESDVRLALDGNECGTATKANQIAEGMWREKKTYSNWTKITVPIFYFNNDKPTKMNIIFSASNYPNFRANSGLYAGNSLYVDDVEMIYSAKIQKLYIGNDDKEWKGFDPNTEEIQTYSLGETATSIPAIFARRGAGSLTNARGTTVSFKGRLLEEGAGKEMQIVYGDLENKPTTITVKSEDGKSQMVYKIQFQRAPSTNATLAEVFVNGISLADFRPAQTNYTVELPYGTTAAPVLTFTQAEDAQTVAVNQATSPTGTATITVTAADGTTKKTYSFNFKVGELSDVTLKDIKVNGKSIPGFSPAQAVYKVSLPTTTTAAPTIEAVSAYDKGAQTITITTPTIEQIKAGNAQAQVRVSAPGATSEKVYKLNFKIEESSYSYLADLQIDGEQVAFANPSKQDDSTQIAFDPEVTTYYVNLKMGTSALPNILYTPGDEFQTITREDGGIDGTTRITVLAGNKSDQTVYKLVFSTEKSEISTLSGIEIGGEPLAGFSPDVTNYSYELPIGTTTLPVINPIAHDEFQTISITTGGLNGKTRISVTAGNGNTTNYYIAFSVKKYDDNTLKSLSVGPYYTLQDENFNPITFDPLRNDYYVKLEKDSLPTVQYELQSVEFQDTVVIYPTSSNGKYKITVRPRNGLSRTYTIQFVYRKSDNVALKMIYIADPIKQDTVALPGFAPDKIDYTFTLDTGAIVMPEVLFDRSEASQVVTTTWDKDNKRVVRISVVAESGAKRTYKIKFIVPSAASTQLNNIQLVENNDTINLPGFKKDVYEYTYPLSTETCPKIITIKAVEDQQVTLTAPYAAGIATIIVKMDEGTSQYTIDFVKAPAETVQLDDILIDNKHLKDFQPTRLNYAGLTYQDQLPKVEGVVSNATVELRWKGDTAFLNVQDTIGNKVIYSVAFTRELSGDNSLQGIYADGVLIDGFVKTKLNYTYDLPAGSTYPTLTYEVAKSAEVVFFGQVADGKWAVIVSAENDEKQTYTVQYNIAKYNDATLVNMELAGYALTPAFDSNTFEYSVTIDEGAELPKLTVETRPGQTILQNNASDTLQQVIVFAESGANKIYTVKYTRTPSSNALLANILINGDSLEGFDPTIENYIDSLDRHTQVVPNVFPVGQLSNQTITTYFSRPNGVTRIHVVAQDGTYKDYSIAFPMRKSNNSLLGDLYLDSDEAEIKFKPATTDYVVELPYEAAGCPKVIYEKAEPEQRIDFISRPIGDTTQVIVTAENGDTKTYNILFKRTFSSAENALKSLTIGETNKKVDLKSNEDHIYEIKLPYNSRSLTVDYTKNYDEQTVFIQPGGVRDTTFIRVKANRGEEQDVVYKLVPKVDNQNPAVLDTLSINGEIIPGYDKNRFTYIYNVNDVGQVPQVEYIKGEKVKCSTRQNLWSWEATVTSQGYSNTYKIFFHYPNEKLPNNGDFTKRVMNAKGTSYKPEGWNATNDYVSGYNSADYVTMNNGGPVQLYNNGHTTLGWFASYGCAPAMLNLAQMTANHVVSGNSRTKVQGEVGFHNTPDAVVAKFAYPEVDGDGKGALIRCRFVDNYNQEYHWDITESSKQSTAKEYNQTFDLSGVPVKAYDVIVDASSAYLNGGKGQKDAKMQVYYIHFRYNSTPKEVSVNGINGVLNGKKFTVTLEDSEDVNIRSYEFNGEVVDQAQILTWGDPVADEEYSVRTATIRNFAEDGTYTDGYTLQVKRPLNTNNELAGINIGTESLTGFVASKRDYVVTIPASQYYLPDLVPVPASSLQTITSVFNETDSTMTITVTPEKGAAKVYTVKFVTALSNDVTLKALTAEGITYDPGQKTYDITAERLPLISFEKQSDLQTVVLNNGVLTVTAEDGTVGTYTINRLDPAIEPNGTIAEFSRGKNPMSDFGGATYDKEAAKPAEYITFSRKQATDSVIFVQTPDKMTWTVPETSKSYVWTYPTDESGNTNLKMISVNGEDYSAFTSDELNYILTSDSTIVIEAKPAESVQTLTSTFDSVSGGVLYTTTVKAQNGAYKTYTVRATRPLGNSATLEAIYLDTMLIEGFAPDKTVYTVTLPIAAGAKIAQPKMPNITYIAGQKGQNITVKPGALNRDGTTIAVVSEDGEANNEYTITILAQKSACADLSGITVNGEALDHFEAGRHYYSVSLKTDEVDINYTSDDRFQTVLTKIGIVKEGHQYRDTLHVIAEDGVTESDYIIDIYIENQSNDAQLANILLNGKSMDKFEPLYNSDIIFDGGNNNYEIKLPATTKMPEVNAQLKMDGQHVDIEHRRDEHMNIDSIMLTVTAVDSITKNTYVLRFIRPMSTNSQLSLIEINNEPIENFEPNTYFYAYDMKSGEPMPRITVETADEAATYDEPDYSHEGRITITVYAQDYALDKNHKSTYTIAVNVKKSDIATLDMIYQGRDSLPGFKPTTFYYAYELDAKENFPDLSWQDPDTYPVVAPIDTVEYDSIAQKLVRQIKVTAEDTTVSNTYTIAYTIRKSDVDTLQMIFIGSKPMPNFNAKTMEYEYKLTAAEVVALDGEMPEIDPIPGEEGTQKIETLPVRDNYGVKTIGYKHVVTVTAAAGNSRTYTVHYPRELSDDATLQMIFIDETPLANFDAERNSYKIELDYGVPVPNVTEATKDFQTVRHNQHGDTVEIIVTAELESVQNIYTIVFERQKSDVTTLRNIILIDEKGKQLPYDLFAFKSEQYDYTIEMPYVPGDTTYALPDLTFEKMDSLQIVTISDEVIKPTEKVRTVLVVAPNGEDEAEYKLLFQFARNNDANLTDIQVHEVSLQNFKPTTLDYKYVYPYGSDSSAFITNKNVREAITIVKSDPKATDEIFVADDASIIITVTAQDGKSQNTYSIQQVIGKDTVNTIKMLYLDGDSLKGFDPENTFYTYILKNGASTTPAVFGVPMSENAEVDATEDDPKVGTVNDTLNIYCVAQDGTERIYRIFFQESSINDALKPTANDVFIRRVKGAYQLFVATIRKDVTFIMYDHTGRRVYYSVVPDAEPNDVIVGLDSEDKDVLLNVDVNPNSGLIIDVIPGQIYMYNFVESGRKKIKSGKIMVMP